MQWMLKYATHMPSSVQRHLFINGNVGSLCFKSNSSLGITLSLRELLYSRLYFPWRYSASDNCSMQGEYKGSALLPQFEITLKDPLSLECSTTLCDALRSLLQMHYRQLSLTDFAFLISFGLVHMRALSNTPPMPKFSSHSLSLNNLPKEPEMGNKSLVLNSVSFSKKYPLRKGFSVGEREVTRKDRTKKH